MGKQLAEKMMARIEMVGNLLSNTKTITIVLYGKEYQMEYLIIPAMTAEGNSKPAIFNYPGGMTHLAPCIEPFIFLDRRSIHISPMGYGKSSDIPGWIFRGSPFHGAVVALQFLKNIGEKEIVVYGHSNASSIVLQISLWAFKWDIKISEIVLVNPLGLRKISRIWAAMAFPIFGMLSRVLSCGRESPYDFLKDCYESPKHPFNFWKVWYELTKSSKDQVPLMFKMIEMQSGIPSIRVIQSEWDWATFHMPWTDSNEQILRENVPFGLLKIIKIPGLHNVTLGRDSEKLSNFLS